jgi:hypothetical protein
MGFKRPQDYVDALKELEGFSLIGMEVRDGSLLFKSPYGYVAFPLRNKAKEWGCRVVRYGLNKLDVLVNHVKYNDQFRQVRLFNEDGDVIADVELKNVTRKEWLLSELYGKNLHDSMNVNQHKKYVTLASGVVFTADADGLTGAFVNWLAVDSPVEHILDQGDAIYIETVAGHAVELLFKDGDVADE